VFEHNIVYWATGEPLSKEWLDKRLCMDHNLYWKTSGGAMTMTGMPWSQWQKSGHDRSSLVVDPGFANAARGDFHLSGLSPALKVNFHPFDLAQAGPRPGHMPPLTADHAIRNSSHAQFQTASSR
jgi:hypothetical protein